MYLFGLLNKNSISQLCLFAAFCTNYKAITLMYYTCTSLIITRSHVAKYFFIDAVINFDTIVTRETYKACSFA